MNLRIHASGNPRHIISPRRIVSALAAASIIELARMQVMAFFYWITIQPGEVNGRFWQGKLFPLQPVRRADWGNEQLRFFMAETKDWDWRVHAVTADGYFKLAIKKRPDRENWSFAVEWNESYRIVGFFGETEGLIELRNRVPELAMETVHNQGDNWIRQRREASLPEDEDALFDPPLDAISLAKIPMLRPTAAGNSKRRLTSGARIRSIEISSFDRNFGTSMPSPTRRCILVSRSRRSRNARHFTTQWRARRIRPFPFGWDVNTGLR